MFRDWYHCAVAEGTDSFEKFQYHLLEQVKGLPLSGSRILDVGCGKGAASLYLALFSEVQHVTALDEAAGNGSPIGVTSALKDAIATLGVEHIAVVEADIMANAFPDASFDIVLANNALHHVVECGLVSRNADAHTGYVRLFGELMRLLAPGGFLSIREFSRSSLWRWSPVKLRWKMIEWDLHPTLPEWLSVVMDAGFSILGLSDMVPYRLRFLSPILANRVGQFLLSSGFVITAQA